MQAQKSAAFHRAFTKADLCEYYVNLEANTFDTFKVEPSLMTVFEQSYTWDELIRHFVDSYVVETDKKAVSSFYDRGYIAEKLKGLETELSLECRITLNGEERCCLLYTSVHVIPSIAQSHFHLLRKHLRFLLRICVLLWNMQDVYKRQL